MKIKNQFIYAGGFALLATFFFTNSSLLAQDKDAESFSYSFKSLADITATSVKDQCRTGTCWSYSTSSFLESEAARISGHVVDL